MIATNVVVCLFESFQPLSAESSIEGEIHFERGSILMRYVNDTFVKRHDRLANGATLPDLFR
jgi:hypothetical protein